jgi:hypothetical protein
MRLASNPTMMEMSYRVSRLGNVRATKEVPTSDSAGGGAVDVAAVDAAMLAAPEPQQTGKAQEAKQTFIETVVVVVRIGRRLAGVLRHGPGRGTDAGEAYEEERAEQ